MPCRCDGYDIDTTEKFTDLYKHEHQTRCQAQSLAHKLARMLEDNKIHVPHPLQDLISKHRKNLLDHKKEELKKDIDTAKGEYGRLVSNKTQIEKLGGVATGKLLADIEEAKKTLDGLLAINPNTLLG